MEIHTITIEFIDNGYVFSISGFQRPVGLGGGYNKKKDYYFKTLSEGFTFIKKEFGIEENA